jgi:hypothetical protein
MNQEFNMKKLTALLLGTVVSIAFTADAFAENKQVAFVKEYFNSNDGRTGTYLGASGNMGDIDDITAPYLDATGSALSEWQLDEAYGGKMAIGHDFGKIRLDWRVGAIHSQVETIDNAALEASTSTDAVMAYSTLNLGIDLYRFELVNRDFIQVAITPYVGIGGGYGGGWMTGKKNSDTSATNAKRDVAGDGMVYTMEAGVLFNLSDWVGLTFGYNYLHQEFNGIDASAQMGEVGIRFTY